MNKTKHLTIGVIIGFVLSFAVAANAEEIKSYIGMKVEGQLPITIDGEVVENPGIVVDQTTYVPLRVAGKLFGYNTAYVDGEVLMTKRPESVTKSVYGEEDEILRQLGEVTVEVNSTTELLQRTTESLKTMEDYIQSLRDQPEKYDEETIQYAIDIRKATMNAKRSKIAEYESKIEQLQQKKAQLQSQLPQ